MKHIKQTSTPALERGLLVLDKLRGGETRSLEGLAAELEIPKSSLLRIMDTLCQHGYVTRDAESKVYKGLVTLVPTQNRAERLRSEIQVLLVEMAAQLESTVEWYTPQPTHALLEQRQEWHEASVQISATLGFKRAWWGESEAVARLGICHLNLVPTPSQRKKCWTYQNGDHIPVTQKAWESGLRQAATGSAYDLEYNSHGIRRFACAVRSAKGKLIGMVAVPTHFHPKADKTLQHGLAQLEKAVATLETRLEHIV